ncbi:ABC transporter, ATP-binding protein [Corynebacterium efficiens YS-314]|uniref:Trehalose import ATP-binding protein SugC n=1 Tax=Corynebacterium efficiens (strain DSM 44549 / YS-314 / AJ 12310 / JCM 11189 / NBRC 100395) TaxID=196164 RepID=Q8FR90_COREF|nr:sn-glycerol-3-phosphate ABC transporter ATP-binding protein UgpC [Corynebacterium efficiens]EEW50555.1 ABC transporter, ATP-binding protein [Corynebacterium efficiens YS-314]BAC17681.1 putative maltose ABC transporter ATP-hydrolyzing subunit [Corynebacterium efficiens YS-314]
MATITLDHVDKLYPSGYHAITDANLDIRDGEFVILVGPSGCGKSTLLNMIAGLEDITGGELRFDDQVVNDLSARDRDIAMVFQSYALYPHMTVRENIEFPLKLSRMPKSEIQDKVAEVSASLGLDEYLDRKPAQLSGGQRQRVAMGRAIVRRPKVFLMDEPLSNLDAKLRVQMRAEIARLQQDLGVTTVYVTHDQTEAMTLGDRVVVMRKGVIQQAGSPDELYASPTNLFVASFIGSPSMNFMPGRLRGTVVSTGFGDIHLPDVLIDAASRATSESVILGLRPEAFDDAYLVAPEKRDQGLTISATLSLVESTGADRFVYFSPTEKEQPSEAAREAAREAGVDELGGELVARLTNATRVVTGDTMDLWFSPESLYLFDGETGDALRRDEVAVQ